MKYSWFTHARRRIDMNKYMVTLEGKENRIVDATHEEEVWEMLTNSDCEDCNIWIEDHASEISITEIEGE